jgi:hypothetical protein
MMIDVAGLPPEPPTPITLPPTIPPEPTAMTPQVEALKSTP